ncbi:MAG: EamA family transporter [Proteobacteria bacterium]|nr:EamA family transporter [Pseudomonadota bacterium]
MKNFLLYASTVLIWGSTWLAITFQLDTVAPMVSVAYRFTLAAIILLIYCKIKGLNLNYKSKDHIYFALLGFFLFSMNYWSVYISEIYITSGLVAVLFSSIVFFNTFNGYFILKSPITLNMIIGAIIGFAGIALTFEHEIQSFEFSDHSVFGLILGLIAAFSASLGNITAEFISRRGLPVMQTNAFGMAYGAIVMLGISLITGQAFVIPQTFSYISSLLYLSVFGSIVAFGLYLTLLGRIGSAKSAYVAMLIPVVALVFSTVFEDFYWSLSTYIGVGLILAGNYILMQSKTKISLKSSVLKN